MGVVMLNGRQYNTILKGSEMTITDYWQGTQSEYEALSVYHDYTQYIVLTDELTNISKVYNGTNLVYPASSKVTDYDYYIEDFYISDDSLDLTKKTTVLPNIYSTANYSREWQIDIVADVPLNASELVLFGTTGSVDPRIEFMGYNGYYRIYTTSPTLAGDRNIVTLADGNNKKITIKKQNSKLSFYLDDVFVKEFNYVVSSGSDSNQLRLGAYYGTGGNYFGRGIKIKSFGFKWLS